MTPAQTERVSKVAAEMMEHLRVTTADIGEGIVVTSLVFAALAGDLPNIEARGVALSTLVGILGTFRDGAAIK